MSGYRVRDVDRLLEGEIWDGESWRDAEPRYYEARSRVEAMGDVDGTHFAEILDVDRALDELRRLAPMAAALAYLVRDGWDLEEIQELFGAKLRTPPERLIRKAKAFIRSYLAGDGRIRAAEAYRRGRWPTP